MVVLQHAHIVFKDTSLHKEKAHWAKKKLKKRVRNNTMTYRCVEKIPDKKCQGFLFLESIEEYWRVCTNTKQLMVSLLQGNIHGLSTLNPRLCNGGGNGKSIALSGLTIQVPIIRIREKRTNYGLDETVGSLTRPLCCLSSVKVKGVCFVPLECRICAP